MRLRDGDETQTFHSVELLGKTDAIDRRLTNKRAEFRFLFLRRLTKFFPFSSGPTKDEDEKLRLTKPAEVIPPYDLVSLAMHLRHSYASQSAQSR